MGIINLATLRGGHLTSFDIADQRLERVKSAWTALGSSRMRFALADLEDAERVSAVARAALSGADFLFNDGWHKDVESAIYAKYLPIGAGLLQHDYSYDHARPQAGYRVLEDLGFEPLYENIAVHLNSCARFWVRAGSGGAGGGGGGGGGDGGEDDSRSSGSGSDPSASEAGRVEAVEIDSSGEQQQHQQQRQRQQQRQKQQDDEQAFSQFAMLHASGRELLQKWRQKVGGRQ